MMEVALRAESTAVAFVPFFVDPWWPGAMVLTVAAEIRRKIGCCHPWQSAVPLWPFLVDPWWPGAMVLTVAAKTRRKIVELFQSLDDVCCHPWQGLWRSRTMLTLVVTAVLRKIS